MEQTAEIGTRGDAIAGSGLFERTRAANPLIGFQDEHTLPAAREVGSASEAIVAGADNDRIPWARNEFGNGGGEPDAAHELSCQ
jgi:hypothetical protein